MCCEEKTITVARYECPESTYPQTKRMLRKLRKDGILIFNHDDGPANVTRHELMEIAGAIGIDYYENPHNPYEVVLIDSKTIKPVDGAMNIRDSDWPEV